MPGSDQRSAGGSRSGDSPSSVQSPVQVVVRFRPRVGEEEAQDKTAFLVLPNGKTVESMDGTYSFDFQRAFSEAASQEDIFEHVGRPVVADVLDGYNGTILAYGQTASGKTYSMFGPEEETSLQGIVPRSAREVFRHIEESLEDKEYTLRCSFLEVYKEKMKDLLRPSIEVLRVKELPQRGVFVDGLSRDYVTCMDEVTNLLRAGLRGRVIGKTRCNLRSSRSHVIFVLHVEEILPQGDEKLGKLTLVDLAGSEKLSKSESLGETLEEAKKINWSLSALGKVIDALAEQRMHVPYRDSQLTRVLQEALGGNCRTTLMVAASGCAQHTDETLSSLRFATRAKNVRNEAKVNYTYSPEQLLLLVGKLQKQLSSAHEQILELGGLPESPFARPRVSPRSEASPSAWAEVKTWETQAIARLQAALVAQEETLSEARLLRASREDGAERFQRPGTNEQDFMSERFRALQHGVASRCYQWRLELEKFKTASLEMEVKMRKQYSQDLEMALVDAKSTLSDLQASRSRFSLVAPAHAPRTPRIARPVPRTPASPSKRSVQSPKEARKASPGFQAEVLVAGTGDTGEGHVDRFLDSERSEVLGREAQMKSQMEGQALQNDSQILQEQVERQSSKLRELWNQMHVKDLQLAALRHEIQIKDAMLGCLQDEERRRFEVDDFELEQLLEKAMAPLGAILTREQMARAEATPR